MVKKLYSITDWDYHQGKVTWEDLVDEDLNVVVTVCILEIAKEEAIFDVNYTPSSSTICALGDDDIWNIYLNIATFTVQDIQNALDELSKLTGITYQFTSDVPPGWEELV